MLKKTMNKGGKTSRVTFSVPADVKADTVELCGEFNDWERHPMTRRKDGRFSTTLTLETGRKYRFRYFLDGQRWENDWEADSYASNEFGSEDSIVEL
jgi:1,4-alpha-glucan branching enzyme